MRIDFLGHSAFLLTTAQGTRILTDPYESGGFSGRVGYAPIDEEVDLVVITHDHLDHSHTASLPGEFEVIRHDGTFRDVTVRSVQAWHDRFEGEKFGGAVDMKVIELAEGLVLCHAGDLGEDLSSRHLEDLGPIDVFIPPVGGFYTLDAAGAYDATMALAPNVVIPSHFKTSRCGFDVAPAEPFIDRFERVERPGGSVWSITPDALPSELLCVALDPRL